MTVMTLVVLSVSSQLIIVNARDVRPPKSAVSIHFSIFLGICLLKSNLKLFYLQTMLSPNIIPSKHAGSI